MFCELFSLSLFTLCTVLSSTKGEVRATKGKDADNAKWDEEIRKSIASKKATPASLTKQQQAALQVQLEKETKIRENVRRIKSNLDRGLYFIQSLVSADVAEFRFYTSSVVNVLLEGPLVGGAFLVGDLAFETYLVSFPQLVKFSRSNMEQNLAKSTSERLDTLRKWVGIATLRSLNISAVPEELRAEPINCKLCDQTSFGILVHTTIPIALVIRVLHRLRSLSEQAPFDAATFSYAFPLLSQVLLLGGVSPADEDEALEQVALALGIIRFHCGECMF